MEKANIGLIGLAVMGSNLARNISNNGYKTVVYNRSADKTKEFVNTFGNDNLIGSYDLKEFVETLETPRKIIMMVKSGDPVDQLVNQLLPFLEKGDILIDCGNSFYKDSVRRYDSLQEKGINFVGCGVSGGEEGALNGPSIMPGGSEYSWDQLKDIFESISADDFSGGKCVTYIGKSGAGHFVKTVHNGIEYAVMETIAEAYDSFRKVYNLTPKEISDIFEKYNEGKLNSYLFEITYKVLRQKDDINNGEYLIDKILDKAGAKGTGKWTSIEGFERARSISTIGEATFSRAISSDRDLRLKLSKIYKKNLSENKLPLEEYINKLENTLYVSMLFIYAQGYALILETSNNEKWDINLSDLSRIWQGGCIIRAQILDFLTKAFQENTNFEHIFELDQIRDEITRGLEDYKGVVNMNLDNEIPIPSISSGLNYFYSITQEKASANMIQGLRDFFGAHTYERIDKEGSFHTNWEN